MMMMMMNVQVIGQSTINNMAKIFKSVYILKIFLLKFQRWKGRSHNSRALLRLNNYAHGLFNATSLVNIGTEST